MNSMTDLQFSEPRKAHDPNNQEGNNMAFVNEYIPETDYEKYDLRRICGERNEINRGHMYSRSWTIDRERKAFLIQVWSHHEAQFNGWAFYWKGEWIFFEMTVAKAEDNPEESSCWSLYRIKNLSVPARLEGNKEDVLSAFYSAWSAYAGGGIFCNRTHRSATVEFIEE